MKKSVYLLITVFLFVCVHSFTLAAKSHVGDLSGAKGNRKVQLVAVQEIVNPAVANLYYVTQNLTIPTSAALKLEPIAAKQPDVARKLSIGVTGTAASIHANATSNVLPYIIENLDCAEGLNSYWIVGTDINGNTIGEALAFAENTAATINTTKAYKTITRLNIPHADGAGAVVNVGILDALGINAQLDYKAQVLLCYFDDAIETTWPTVTIGDEIAENTIDINGTLNGSKDIDVVYCTDLY